MTIIALVRHGENDWVNENRLAGWLPDIHLNENGVKQAADAAERLSALPVKAVYSSPVTRCLETAEMIAKSWGLNITLLEDVGEVRYGEWEGKKVKKLSKKNLWHVVQFFPSRMRFPGGEALFEVQFRAVQALEKLVQNHEDETIIVVSHADVIKLVLAHFLGIHIDLFQRIAVSPASVSLIHLSSQGWVRVLRLNDNGPIKPISKPENKKENK